MSMSNFEQNRYFGQPPLKGALDKFNIIPKLFQKKNGIF